MRLHKFQIHNFKGIYESSFEWDDIVILIGENNAGKSTVLQALECFLSGNQIRDPILFHDHETDADHPLELTGHFDQLSEEEKMAQAISHRLSNGEWIIKKKFWQEKDADNQLVWKEQYYSFSSEEVFDNWPDSDNSWTNFPAEYQDLIEKIPERGARPNNQTRQLLRELVRQSKPELVTQSQPEWIPNPGGGGNWKSNANSILPQLIFVRAVHEASDEAVSKEASAYGKIMRLIVERKLMQRPEVIGLKAQIETVLKLFRPEPAHPELQAEEIREVEASINQRLNEISGGRVVIRTTEPDIQPMLLPSTTLVIKDRQNGVETHVADQGHGLQRVLILTLLQVLAEIESGDTTNGTPKHILAVEDPELYMHPQMERKMRDALQRVASQGDLQVICTTHSPVFLDVANHHKSIIRVVKDLNGLVSFFQVTQGIFDGPDAESEKDRLRLVACFHPTVNEVFFSRRVVLLEERTAVSAFERAAELTGVFTRHSELQRDVTLVDCNGKGNIPMFQKVLTHFRIPYTVIHDEDRGDSVQEALNLRIGNLLQTTDGQNLRFIISPTNLEQMLGYVVGKDKPYQALKMVERLHASTGLPPMFVRALNWVYFGQDTEP